MFRDPTIPRRRVSPGRKYSHLPKGECRFILLHPEVQEQRCACVGFYLNESTRGSTCECGHQACYHEGQQDEAACREELEILKEKVRILEEEFGREKENSGSDILCRTSELEETVDRQKAEMEMEIKGVYRDIGGLWQNVSSLQGGLQKWTQHCDDRVEALVDANHSVRTDFANVEKRLIDADDASMRLEERIETLETAQQTVLPHRQKASTPPSPEHSQEPQEYISQGSWTVHISLLPDASQMMPFEKDTNAYKRCLSRGLHQMVAIPAHDAESFNRSVSEAFHVFLLGRPWMPLVAQLCDAPALVGLPMLRQLPREQVDINLYDYQWLRQNCATVAPDGKIADLYLAMRDGSLTWTEICRAPKYTKGLEECWYYDRQLDKQQRHSYEDFARETSIENEASAGDILSASLSPVIRTKRPASMLSRKSSFGSIEGELIKRVRLNCTESVDRLQSV